MVTLGLVAAAAVGASGAVWHVDAGADAGGDGASWATAFRFLQDALTGEQLAAGDEIWVAEGRYHPDRSSTWPGGTDLRTATFKMVHGVRVYGGFPAGGGDGSFAARDPDRYESVLSGDLFEPAATTFDPCIAPPAGAGGCFDGTPGIAGCHDGSCCNVVCETFPYCCAVEWDAQCAEIAADACSSRVYNVVYAFVIDAPARLDGFTITGGLADEVGSYFRTIGGGMLARQGDISVVRCRFVANRALSGGGLMLLGSLADNAVVNCTFRFNRADEGGGAAADGGDPDFDNCVFQDNRALTGRGGAVRCSPTSGAALSNCTVAGNSAAEEGGGVSGVAFVVNSILWGNTPDQVHGALGVAFSCVEGGHPGLGNFAGDPGFVDPAAGNLRLGRGSSCVDRASNGFMAADPADLDGDGILAEPTPLDLDLAARVLDGVVDAGAYEQCRYDLDGNGVVGISDLAELLGAWGTSPDGPPDFDGDGIVGISDFLELLGRWGGCG